MKNSIRILLVLTFGLVQSQAQAGRYEDDNRNYEGNDYRYPRDRGLVRRTVDGTGRAVEKTGNFLADVVTFGGNSRAKERRMLEEESGRVRTPNRRMMRTQDMNNNMDNDMDNDSDVTINADE